LNLISGVQWQHTNQHSLPSWTSFHHLKLRPCGRQMAQHISWSQGHSTSLLISKSSLWTSTLVWTTPNNISFWFWFYFILLFILFWVNREVYDCSHMTCHIMSHHISENCRKNSNDDIRSMAIVYSPCSNSMVDL